MYRLDMVIVGYRLCFMQTFFYLLWGQDQLPFAYPKSHYRIAQAYQVNFNDYEYYI